MAFRLIASPDVASRISGKDVRSVVYGNFCDVVTWEELLAVSESKPQDERKFDVSEPKHSARTFL
jgi:hypothetical protein